MFSDLGTAPFTLPHAVDFLRKRTKSSRSLFSASKRARSSAPTPTLDEVQDSAPLDPCPTRRSDSRIDVRRCQTTTQPDTEPAPTAAAELAEQTTELPPASHAAASVQLVARYTAEIDSDRRAVGWSGGLVTLVVAIAGALIFLAATLFGSVLSKPVEPKAQPTTTVPVAAPTAAACGHGDGNTAADCHCDGRATATTAFVGHRSAIPDRATDLWPDLSRP